MNYRLILSIIGIVLRCEGLLMLLPAMVALVYGEARDGLNFVAICVAMLAISFLLRCQKPQSRQMKAREGFLAVALTWIVLALFGALPFYFCGSFRSFVDCFFESMSGFTTTGATILPEVESLSKSILFWRSFTHWIGGMGVLVFILGLMPNLDASNIHLMKAESPGPMPGKLVPRLKESSRILYGIYLSMTMAETILLFIAGLPLYDSVITALGTAGTGGFSNRNASIGAYGNLPAEIIVTVFMLAFAVNFSLYFYLLKRQGKAFLQNEELRLYLGVVSASMVFIAVNIMPQYGNSFFAALRQSSFQVASIVSSTGYATTDFNLWPAFSKMVLLFLMLIGACAGSTGGGVKFSRLLIMLKALKKELTKVIHPRLFNSVKTENHIVREDVVHNISSFFFAYIMLCIGASLIVSLDNFDLITTVTAVLSAVSNIGPGLELAGPMGNFGIFSDMSKWVLSVCMLAGRLEILPILILPFPSTWRKDG